MEKTRAHSGFPVAARLGGDHLKRRVLHQLSMRFGSFVVRLERRFQPADPKNIFDCRTRH